MHIAITGKMGSGKSFLTEKILREFDCYETTSFASRVKELAIELFGMSLKDRGLLINLATKMREIDPDVWINCVFRFINKKKSNNFVVIDDLRLANEYSILKSSGWFLIKIDIDEQNRQNRLKIIYGDEYESHKTHFNSITENDVVSMDDSNFDYVIRNDNDIENVIEIIRDYLKTRTSPPCLI
tara:strand:- start:214 stop:765 length:552 start_codon:yes stop_codon:yes gene_type:complete